MKSTSRELIDTMEAPLIRGKSIASVRPWESETEVCQVAEVVNRMIYAYRDRKGITISWNCMPLLFRSKMDSLIDAKYLAAIRELIRHSREQSDQFVYRACILFQTRATPPSLLLALTSFTSFKKSWQIVQSSHRHFIFQGDLTLEQVESPLLEDHHQLKIDF